MGKRARCHHGGRVSGDCYGAHVFRFDPATHPALERSPAIQSHELKAANHSKSNMVGGVYLYWDVKLKDDEILCGGERGGRS